MPKRQSRKPPRDENQAAFAAKQRVIALTEGNEAPAPSARTTKVVPLRRRKNPAAVALGRLGGLKSAQARMDQISPEERSRIASHAARERWKKIKNGQ